MKMFEEIVGAEHVTEREGVLYVAPASTEEVSAVLKRCAEAGLVVSARGGGTKYLWGNAVAAQVVLETRRLAGIREHVWQDMTATVGAGTTWQELEQALAAHGQRVALDALFAGSATVGGVIATNDSGSLRMRYGSLRDLVLGMTIVLADGTIARSGGKVVKNVAGYDLPKLLTGSFGTLGVITEVTFRLHPLQTSTKTWTLRAADVRVLAEVAQKIVTGAMSVESLQMRNEVNGFVLDVRFATLPESLAEHEARLRAFAGDTTMAAGGDEVWAERETLFGIPGATVLKVTSLPAKMAAIVDGFSRVGARCVADAVGIVTVALLGKPDGIAALIEDLRARLRADGGMVVVLRAADGMNAERWGGSPPAIEVMRAIKREFDPKNVLNPGTFVGGI